MAQVTPPAAPAPAAEAAVQVTPDPFWRRYWWFFCRTPCQILCLFIYRQRTWGKDNIPRQGPVLILSNHQSFIDPMIVGVGGRRMYYSMARSTLFKKWGFGALLRSLSTIPVERGEADMGAMRACIEAMKQGRVLLVFPEGTRTTDGTTKKFASGTMLLVRRAKPVVVPVAVEGGFDIWPRGRKFPSWRGRTAAMFGPPIPADELLAMDSKEALTMLRDQIETMRQELCDKLGNPAAKEPRA